MMESFDGGDGGGLPQHIPFCTLCPFSKCWFSSCTLMTQQSLSRSPRNLQKTVYLALFVQPPTETLVFGSLKLPGSDALLNHPHDQKGIKIKPATAVSEGCSSRPWGAVHNLWWSRDGCFDTHTHTHDWLCSFLHIHQQYRFKLAIIWSNTLSHPSLSALPVLSITFMFPFPQGVKPASYNKVMDPEIKEIIGECICQKKEERWVTVQPRAKGAHKVPSYLSCRAAPPRFIAVAVTVGLSALWQSFHHVSNSFKEGKNIFCFQLSYVELKLALPECNDNRCATWMNCPVVQSL